MVVSKISDYIQIKIKMPNPGQSPPASSKAPNKDLKDRDVLCILKSRERAKIWNMGVSKTSDNIQIEIKMPNPSQETPVSSQAPSEDLKNTDVLYTLKIKIDGQNSDHGCIKDQ